MLNEYFEPNGLIQTSPRDLAAQLCECYDFELRASSCPSCTKAENNIDAFEQISGFRGRYSPT